MDNSNFIVYNELSIDYKLLGTYPINIDKFKNDEELLNYFIECFKLTFLNTVFNYYGSLEDAKIHIESSLLMEELDFKNRTNKEKWIIYFLIVYDLFFSMHNTYLAQDTISDVIDYFDFLSDEERLNIVHDLNFALFFGIEECLIVTPSKIKELEASDDDTLILHELIENRDNVLNIFRANIRKRDIEKERFEDIFKLPLDKNFIVNLYDCFITMWIEMIDSSEAILQEGITDESWREVSAEVFAIISTFLALVIDDENVIIDTTQVLYTYIMTIYKEKLDVEFDVCSVNFAD